MSYAEGNMYVVKHQHQLQVYNKEVDKEVERHWLDVQKETDPLTNTNISYKFTTRKYTKK